MSNPAPGSDPAISDQTSPGSSRRAASASASVQTMGDPPPDDAPTPDPGAAAAGGPLADVAVPLVAHIVGDEAPRVRTAADFVCANCGRAGGGSMRSDPASGQLVHWPVCDGTMLLGEGHVLRRFPVDAGAIRGPLPDDETALR